MILSSLSRIISPTLSRQLFMMAKQYDDVIDFTLGDPDIPTPLPICKAAANAAYSGLTHYSPNAGLPALREAIAYRATKDYGIEYLSRNVAITVGATQAVYLTLLSCINPEDEVIILAPYWIQYENIVKLLGGKAIIIDSFNREFEPYPEEIRKAVTTKTRAIIINSPNNPSGYVYSAEFVKEISVIARENRLLIIDDEAYSSLVYEQTYQSIAQYCNKQEVAIINSFSKQFSMTGWRIGYIIADEPLIDAIIKFQQNMAVCVATPNQYAALEAISHSKQYSTEIKSVFKNRRSVLMNELDKIQGIRYNAPQGAFYVFLDISQTGMDSLSFSFSLLEKEHVAVIPGVAFGESFNNYVRLAFTLREDLIIEGIRRIARFVNRGQ